MLYDTISKISAVTEKRHVPFLSSLFTPSAKELEKEKPEWDTKTQTKSKFFKRALITIFFKQVQFLSYMYLLELL